MGSELTHPQERNSQRIEERRSSQSGLFLLSKGPIAGLAKGSISEGEILRISRLQMRQTVNPMTPNINLDRDHDDLHM
jgi:hypothetical protein